MWESDGWDPEEESTGKKGNEKLMAMKMTGRTVFLSLVLIGLILYGLVKYFNTLYNSSVPVVAPPTISKPVEVEPELKLKVTDWRGPWGAVAQALKDNKVEGVSVYKATYEVCKLNGIAVPEWGLKEGRDARKLPAGYELTVKLSQLKQLQSQAYHSNQARSGEGEPIFK